MYLPRMYLGQNRIKGKWVSFAVGLHGGLVPHRSMSAILSLKPKLIERFTLSCFALFSPVQNKNHCCPVLRFLLQDPKVEGGGIVVVWFWSKEVTGSWLMRNWFWYSRKKKVESGIYIFIMPFSYVVWCCGCYWCVKMHNCSVFVSIIITSSVSCIMTYCNLHPEVHDPKRQGTMCLLYAFHNRQASGEDFVEDVTERLTAPSSCVSRLVSKQLC